MAGSGRTLLGALKHWTSVHPEKVLHIFIDDHGNEVERLTYQSLDEKSNLLAMNLRSNWNLNTGDRVLLVFPPCLDFIVSFYACLKADVIAVPVFPPDPRGGRNKKDVVMFTKIQKTCDAKVALTNKTYNFVKKLASFKDMFSNDTSWPELDWHTVDTLSLSSSSSSGSEKDGYNCLDHKPALHSPAFLQFTSGSTSDPKGVIITHLNLASNLDLIVTCLKASEDTMVASWLPLYHDMGLIGSFLGALYCGGGGVYMSPASFIKNPPLWVETMSKYRATHMQGPNFAYGLTARKFLALPKSKRPKNLDLSCVKHMINAAEPVRVQDINIFYAVFEEYGLPQNVIYPTYGLAEHTLLVCSNGKQVVTLDRKILEEEGRAKLITSSSSSSSSSSVSTVDVVGCGFPKENATVDVRIVKHASIANKQKNKSNEDKEENDDDDEGGGIELDGLEVGEIWVKSNSRAFGYWNDPEKSKIDFGGKLKTSSSKSLSPKSQTLVDDHDMVMVDDMNNDNNVLKVNGQEYVDGYLKTGDLGFIYLNELFICGRAKDLIITRGSNIYPQDIERAAEDALPSLLRGGCSAAFTLTPNNKLNKKSQYSENVVSEESEEALYLIAEVTEVALNGSNKQISLIEMINQIRSAVSTAVGCQLDGVYLLKPRTIPKTTSGKIARQWCKKAMHEQTLEVVYEWFDFSRLQNNEKDSSVMTSSSSSTTSSSTSCNTEHNEDEDAPKYENLAAEMTDDEILKIVVDTVAFSVLRVDPSSIDVETPVPNLGLGSMEGVQVLSLIEKRTGVALPTGIMFEEETTLKRLVPLIKAGGGVPKRACVVDLAQLSKINLPKQTEGERQIKATKCTVKSSWRGESFPPNTLSSLPPPSKDMPKDINVKLGEMFSSVLIARSVKEATFMFILSTLLCATRIFSNGENGLRSVLWLLMLSVSLIWLIACLLAIQRLTSDSSSLSSEQTKKKVKVPSIQAQICSFFGAKLLYDERLKPADGPYFVLAFAPAPFLKNINNNEERIEARAQYVEEINTEVANNGGIYKLSHELQHLESSSTSSSSSSSSKVSLPLVMALPQSIGSFALALAASMQCTIFGGSTCSYDENTEVNKTSVQPLPFTFLHSEQELQDLARGGGVDTTNGNDGMSSSISNSSAIPLSLSALNQALQLGGVNNLSSMRSKFIKKVFQNNGTVYYTASMNNHFMSSSLSSSKLSKMKLSELDGKQLSVLNLQLIVNQITLSVIACMKNGSQLVPCLVLGDEQFGTSLSSSTLLDMATPFNQGLRTSTSLFSAFKFALFSLVKKTELAPKPSPLAVVYGAPISLPYTSNPNPLVIQEFVDEYLNSLSDLETKYSHLHSAH